MSNENLVQSENEFSYVLNVSELPKSGLTLKLVADSSEREALAVRYNINAVAQLSTTMRVSTWRKGGLHVDGKLDAVVEQACVVTLEPVEATLSEKFSVYFLPPGEEHDIDHGEINLDADSEDEFDVLTGDMVDLGEVVAEQLAVALDPYPRKPGVETATILPDNDIKDEDDKPNPFAILKDIPVVKINLDKKN